MLDSSTQHPGDAFSASSQRSWLTHLWLTLPFLLLYWLDLYHHQTWFDEVNAWGISAASPNLRTLFHLVHYEAHPWLWYFLLYWPSRLTHDPNMMKWVVVGFGSAIIMIIGLLSPFTRVQKVLLLLSYFVVWEYTVLLRMYVLMFLLALIYAQHRSRRPERILTNLLLLAVMTNVDMTAVVLSGALLIEYLYTLFGPGVPAIERRVRLRPVFSGLVAYVILLGVSYATLRPAKDISWQTTDRIGAHAFSARQASVALGNVIAGPWWPISPEFPHRFWETDAHHNHALFLLVPVVLFGYWQVVRWQRNLLVLMGSSLLLAFGWADVVYLGHVRHWGICFVAFLVVLWLASEQQARQGVPQETRRWSPWAYGLVGLSAVAGVFATASSWTHPLTESENAAAWIRQNEPEDVLLTGFPDTNFIAVAQHLQRPVFLLECECMDTYKLFSHAHDYFLEPDLGVRLDRGLDMLHRQHIILLTYHELDGNVLADLAAHRLQAAPIAQFDRADLKMEDYFLYEVSRPVAATQAGVTTGRQVSSSIHR